MNDVAKSSKGKSDKSEVVDAIEDAEILSSETPDAEVTSDTTDAAPEDDGQDDLNDIPDDEDDLVVGEDAPSDVDTLDDPVVADPPAAPQAEPQSGGTSFFMLLLGGVAAGAIGYGISEYTGGRGPAYATASDLDEQTQAIAALRDEIANAPAPDLSGLEAQIADVSAQLDAATASMADQTAALEERIGVLERQPLSDGTLSDTALAAYQSELDALRAELDAQQDAVMSAASQAEADLAAARAEAERLEQEALAAAEAAAARAAINRVATAVETGAPFADALGDLADADLPAGLAEAAETGVATNAALVADFPEAARAALATARAEGLSDDAGGLGGFLRSQFDVRSTTPQEGDGPDAVLSRAEAAVKEGRVADALAELDALPEVARAEMTDWTAAAQARADVLDAIATLSETYQ